MCMYVSLIRSNGALRYSIQFFSREKIRFDRFRDYRTYVTSRKWNLTCNITYVYIYIYIICKFNLTRRVEVKLNNRSAMTL